jgi:hypothetical protein
MVRLLLVLVAFALCIFSDAASADQFNPKQGSLASEFSARQRCVCDTSYRPTRVVRYRHYRIRTAYVIGYDPLPYRFGSTLVWERPYRYYR